MTHEPGTETRRTARGVLEARLRKQLGALEASEAAIRAEDDEGVHDARVACRRLRAALATCRAAFRVEVSEPLRYELGWWARTLGDRRDLDVARERLADLAADGTEGADQLLAQLVVPDADDRRHRQALQALASPRYDELRRRLRDFTQEPPWTSVADRQAGPFLRSCVRREWDRLAVTVTAEAAPGGGATVDLHDVRKAAKRLRYALELAETEWPRRARRLNKRVRPLTDILGEHQDTLLTRAALLVLADEARAAGAPTAVHLHLHQVEQDRAAELEAEFRRAWSAAVAAPHSWR